MENLIAQISDLHEPIRATNSKQFSKQTARNNKIRGALIACVENSVATGYSLRRGFIPKLINRAYYLSEIETETRAGEMKRASTEMTSRITTNRGTVC